MTREGYLQLAVAEPRLNGELNYANPSKEALRKYHSCAVPIARKLPDPQCCALVSLLNLVHDFGFQFVILALGRIQAILERGSGCCDALF